MNYADVHTAIMTVVQQIVNDHTTYPLAIESANMGQIDYVKQVNPYLKIEIRMIEAEQADIGDRPFVVQWGQIWITAVNKAGQGTLATKTLLDFVRPYFELVNLNGIQCRAMRAAPGKDLRGMWNEPAIVNFYYHRLT